MATRLAREGAVGAGQTSWGPTGFVFAPSEVEAERLRARFAVEASAEGLELQIVEAEDRGAKIDAIYAMIA